ncbi:MAG: TrkA family potassium uptake protein [Litorimonas sp.]
MFKSHTSAVVIGLGTFGTALARSLTDKGVRVLGVDKDPHLVDRMHAELDNTIQADATDVRALRECSIDDHDLVLIAIGKTVEASMLCTYHVRELGAKWVGAKAQSEAHRGILEAIGIDCVFMPEIENAQRQADGLLQIRPD